MADLLKLKNGLETQEIDLLNGTYKLRDGSWATGTPQMATDYNSVPYGAHPAFQNYLTQVETMDLIADDTTHSTIRAAQQNLTQALNSARLWNQHPLWSIYSVISGTDPWFLHWNINGEAEKRSLIYEGSLAGINEQCAEPFIYSNVSLLRMALIRHPFWEPVITASDAISKTTISSLGGTQTFSSVDGDVWARMASVRLSGKSGSGPIYRTWMGVREEMGGVSNFESVWELENGTKYNGAANSTSRADYSGTAHIRDTSLASSLTLYVELSVGAMCAAEGHADYIHQAGEYLVLCRCAVDAGTVGLQMRYGYELGTMIPCEEAFITNTSWRLIELGNVTIPPTGGDTINLTGAYAQFTVIQLYAEQVSGTSILDVDCLVMIPRHHLWTAAGGAIATSSFYAHIIETTENDKYSCYGTAGPSASGPSYILEYSVKDWYIPTGDGIVVVAGERSSVQNSGDNMGLTINYYPRWSMYRSDSGT